MAEYIERERARFEAKRYFKNLDEIQEDLDMIFCTLPAEDVAPVVRCKDCIHWDAEGCGCSLFIGFGETDFCSYGERKEGDE